MTERLAGHEELERQMRDLAARLTDAETGHGNHDVRQLCGEAASAVVEYALLLAAPQADADVLIDTLGDYASHKRGCRAIADAEFGERCDCGFDEALRALDAALRATLAGTEPSSPAEPAEGAIEERKTVAEALRWYAAEITNGRIVVPARQRWPRVHVLRRAAWLVEGKASRFPHEALAEVLASKAADDSLAAPGEQRPAEGRE